MKYVMSHLYLVCKMNKENEMEYILFFNVRYLLLKNMKFSKNIKEK